MKMGSPLSLVKSTRYGETKMGTSGEIPQEEHPKKRRTKKKDP